MRIVVGNMYDCWSTIGIGGGSNEDKAVLKINQHPSLLTNLLPDHSSLLNKDGGRGERVISQGEVIEDVFLQAYISLSFRIIEAIFQKKKKRQLTFKLLKTAATNKSYVSECDHQ